MNSKADGWLFVIAVLAIAAALFMPLPPSTMASSLSLSFGEQLGAFKIVNTLSWFLAAAAFWAFKKRFWPGDRREQRRLVHCALLLVLLAIILRAAHESARAYPLNWPWFPNDAWVWVPWFFVPGLAGILLGGRFGVLTCLAGTLLLYLHADPGPWALIGCMTAPLIGILLLRRSPTRGRVLRAGVGTGATLGIVAASQYGIQGASLEMTLAAIVVPLCVGLLSAFLVLAILPVLEWVLGELSDVTLIEYGTDHPLLDQLRTQAPGTWHHSLNVADLAEKAAAEIGARALFCKSAALYHDIGKLEEPAIFAENNDDPSLHQQLEPQESARKIINHVSHGLELAASYRLPKAFREIIAEHHGLSVVRYFYAKACEPRPDGSVPQVNRALFTYPGPAPSTRESGIIALADIIEAATRSFSSRSEPNLREYVSKLLADRICEGELAQCPLTLADLAKIETVFVRWLKGRNHYRPDYPAKVTEPQTEHKSADIPAPETRSADFPAQHHLA